jgi:hypothetical protein
MIFSIIGKKGPARTRLSFLRLVCGIAFWSMELLLITIVALWALLFSGANFPFRLSPFASAACHGTPRDLRN